MPTASRGTEPHQHAGVVHDHDPHLSQEEFGNSCLEETSPRRRVAHEEDQDVLGAGASIATGRGAPPGGRARGGRRGFSPAASSCSTSVLTNSTIMGGTRTPSRTLPNRLAIEGQRTQHMLILNQQLTMAQMVSR